MSSVFLSIIEMLLHGSESEVRRYIGSSMKFSSNSGFSSPSKGLGK